LAGQRASDFQEAGPGLGLDHPDRERVEAELERLCADPQADLAPALAGFSAAGRSGKAARAELLVRAGDAQHLTLVLPWLTESDPSVAGRLIEFLGRADLLDAQAALRSSALAAVAREPRDPQLRRAAVQALGQIDAPSCAELLEALALDLPAGLAAEAVKALGQIEAGVPALRRLMENAATGHQGLAPEALAAGLEPYGARLTKLPLGGAGAAERAPLVVMLHHPDLNVQRAANRGLDAAMERMLWLGDRERLFVFLKGLVDDGIDAPALTSRVATLCLSVAGDSAGARRAAEALLELALASKPAEARELRFMGHYLGGCAELASAETEAALQRFQLAAEALRAELAERPELRRRQGRASKSEAQRAVEAWGRLGLCHLMAAGALLRGAPEQDSGAVQAELESALEASLEAQLLDTRFDADAGAGGLDLLIDRDLGPRRLLCFAEGDPAWPREERLQWLLGLYAALAELAPGELPGLASAPPRPQDLPATSPARAARRQELLAALRLAELDRLARRISDPSERQNRQLWKRLEQDLFSALERDQERGYVAPLELRTPSLAALDVAIDLRACGRADNSVALLEAMRAELAQAAGSASAGAFFEEWVGARIAWALGSSRSDRGYPEDLELAQKELERALERFAAMQRELSQRLSDLQQGRMGALQLEQVDPQERERLLAQQRLLRKYEAEVRVSQAVHANVRLKDPERARALFEQALELEQNDFMRALLACYRARAGRHAEARFLLARLEPAPDIFYNLACTYALLGEPEMALEYLRRELDPLRLGPRALARQKAWALGDPDLANLRGDGRFEALVAPAEDAGAPAQADPR
jgi:hypothetical protein